MLVITVKDDGVGIEREGLEEIQKELSEENADTSKHVGTLNTNARIRLFYGKEYGVSIESCIEDGTTVILRLPARTMPAVPAAPARTWETAFTIQAGWQIL